MLYLKRAALISAIIAAISPHANSTPRIIGGSGTNAPSWWLPLGKMLMEHGSTTVAVLLSIVSGSSQQPIA